MQVFQSQIFQNSSAQKCKAVSFKLTRNLITLPVIVLSVLLSGCEAESQISSVFSSTAHAEVSTAENSNERLNKTMNSVGFQQATHTHNTSNYQATTKSKLESGSENKSDSNLTEIDKNIDDIKGQFSAAGFDDIGFDDSNEGIASPQETISEIMKGSKAILTTANTLANALHNHKKVPIRTELRQNVSQQFLGMNDIEQRLIEALPEIEYNTNELSTFAQSVNSANWSESQRVDPASVIKIQALLNWHNHGVGAVDGKFAGNTIKAMQTFQKARGLKPTSKMNALTWSMLSSKVDLVSQPVLVQYTLTKEDASLKRQWGNKKNTQYKSVREQLAEKFHMSRALLYRLNPNVKFREGNTITVYNPGQPNLTPVNRVEVYKRKNLLVAYDKNDKIIASYPTTIGMNSPSGTHYVANRVFRPHYNSDFKNKAKTLPPGPNNPVGLVWMGLSKRSFGIHGSPMPEMISRQRSHGCIRLTNWDALALYGTMQHRAKVVFKNS